MKRLLISLTSLIFATLPVTAQEKNDLGEIHGTFQTDVQYYLRDPAIDSTGTSYPDERILANGFLDVTYTKGNFMAGIRYENYQNNRLGLPEGFKGEGIAYRYARYIRDRIDITAGNFYEQFGTGMVFRAYREAGLGLDNALDGVRIIYNPDDGVILKGLIGRQRLYFGKGDGIVRGFDGEWNLGTNLNWDSGTNLILGGSIVSKFEESRDPIYNLPENVAAGGIRANLISGPFNIYAEYAYKANDPNSDNNYIFKNGEALYLSASYAKDNLGVILGAKRYDNFLFRSQREATFTELLINYLPPLAELHTYTLPALYSYNIQANGEVGMQAEVSYNFERNSFLGGKYGTLINLNYSNSFSLDENYIYRQDTLNPAVDSTISGTNGYTTTFPGIGDQIYFQDFNIEIRKKLSRDWKATFTYYNFIYNFSALTDGVVDENITPDTHLKQVYVNAAVLELLWKIRSRHSLRSEMQWMGTDQDRGDWALLLLEYSIAPQWFFALQDSWNYGNPNEELRLHYPLASIGYTRGTTKFQFTYGRQQSGVFCVGGLCRTVPASNGFTLTVTSNF